MDRDGEEELGVSSPPRPGPAKPSGCLHTPPHVRSGVCPPAPPALRARMVSGRTLELGSSLPLQLSPSLPAPSWLPASLHSLGHCPSCFSGSVWQICWKDISRKCVLRMFGMVRLPGTEAFLLHCVKGVGVGQVLLWSSDQGV